RGAGGASLSDPSAQTSAAARGIEGGAGHERIWNTGEIDSKAISGADTTSVTVTVNGSLTGVAGGAALSDASAASLSDASGISGGDGGDEIANAAKISAQATSDVDATAVTVTLSVTKEGVAAGAALSDTSSSAVSAARGIDGGAGNDRIRNDGVTEATSNASADTTSVVVQVAGSLYGAAGGVSMSDSSAAALAQSTGIMGGAGDDVVANAAKVTSKSTADVRATSVSVTVSGSIGLAAGAAFSDASVDSRAVSRGIDGGDGSDVIVNTGEIVSEAKATGKSTSVSVNVALGAGGGATFSDSSALVSADASGIDGGAGHDRIVNRGPITANASSDADVSSVSVTVGAAVSAGASFGDASVVSNTAARGIAGGEGNDEIYNEGKIISGAMSRVDADSVSVNVGMGWAEATTAVTSATTASGIEGGGGDDRIVNRGEIHVGPSPGLDPWMSRVTASSFSFNLAGAANARSSMLAKTKSTGIDGGAGNDSIRNEGLLNVLASSTSSVSGNSAIIFGASSGSVQAGAVAEALGVEGGAGDDILANTAVITANSTTSLLLDSSSFGFGGTGDSGGALVAISRSTGISGGDGTDFILNRGNVSAAATSSLTSRAGATVVFGSSGAGSVSGAVTEATGISGGAGNDRIENSGALLVTATSGMTQSSSSFSFGGTGASGATLAATTLATGISGGEGADAILNRGSITLQAASTLTTDSNFSAAFGTSSGSVTSGGVSQAVGIDGGAGDDRIWNAGTLVAGSSAALNLKASGFTFGGTSGANEALTANSRSVGLSGGAGANGIHNEGALTVTASSSLMAKADVDAAFGATVANGITTAYSTATGISGGEKGDCIENFSVLTAKAVSSADIGKSSYVFGGTASLGGLVTTSAKAEGIAAGDGDNRVLNDLEGTLDVKAESTAKQSGSSSQTFGGPLASADVTAVASAAGISSGIGDDRMVNRGTLVVNAYAKAEGYTSADTFWGSPRAYDDTKAQATATGIDAGDGSNVVLSEGSIRVRAAAETLPDAKADSSVERTTSAATSSSTARASGIVTGSGRDLILNRAELTVEAVAEKATADDIITKAFTDETAFIGTPEAPGLTADATAMGISSGDGGSVVVSEQAVKVTASATGDGEAHAHSNMYDTYAGVWARVSSAATGIETGKGSTLIVNQGLLQVDSGASAVTISFSDSVDDATAKGTAAVSAKAWGIKAAGADSTDPQGTTIIANSAPIRVNAQSYAEGKTGRADSGWFGYGYAVTYADAKAEASGITIGGSNSLAAVENSSELTVKAKANSRASAQGDDKSVFSADSSANAVGIKVGEGNREASISNSGTITVDSTAGVDFIYGSTDARAVGVDAGAAASRIVNSGSIGVTANATGIKTRAEATGLRTGGGPDQIENRGSLSVRADALALIGYASASATGIDAGGGDNRVFNYGTLSVAAQPIAILGATDSRATGIVTGDGSDEIVNAGKIQTTGYASGLFGGPIEGTAISTGGGNDRVSLEAGSETKGIIDLGGGDDTIRFSGSLAVTGDVTGGAGTDTLVFSGDGALGAPITGFEAAIKDGPGTYTLSSLAQVKRMEMNGGTLEVNHSYQMPADGVFQARVNSDGSHGQFRVIGVAGLDGALNVVRGKGIYTNGTKYPILTASTVSGWFTSETLPAPSPLLSFKVAGFSDRVEVEALAKSVTTVATNPAQMRIAQMLDKAMATATGKTAEMLGEFQSLPAQDFQKAFASLNPNSYDRFRRTSLTASQENVRSLHNRMTALRLTQPQYSAAIQAREIANTMSLFKTGPDSGMTPDQAWQLGRLSSAETREGSWMSAFGQRGSLAGAGGYTGYDYRMTGTVIGFDQRHGESFFTGYSSGFSRGSVGFEDRTGQGDVDGASSSIYGSWFANDTYMESALSFTRNRYSNHRSIVVGDLA
ncbi:MAG: hypothetical protein ACM33C_05635, partial [Syntrophaceae bacterium]